MVCKLSHVLQLIITTKEGADASDNVLPVSYPNFTSMVQKGDSIFVGRYLVTGSEDSSLYLTVSNAFCFMVSCLLDLLLCMVKVAINASHSATVQHVHVECSSGLAEVSDIVHY